MNYALLNSIHGTADLKRLRPDQLPELASQMRHYLIETLAPIGGHLGAGLGVVELTIALHYLLNSPRDKIIWDVGHQAYPHKILTGRLPGMPGIRQYGGLCGFTKRAESDHDPFGAGHASTSISAAYGMAVGRDLSHQDHQVVAVIGDGALTGGMAFEAMNHAGGNNNKLLVILNDNEMSIAPNVGAMSSYLARIISGRSYTQAKDTAKRILEKLPGALDAAKRVEEHVKGMITPGTLFEEMGFRYIGPVDGHDFDHLLPTLQNCSRLNGPTLLHVVTRKGLGFSPAEEDPETWHGLGPYDVKTGEPFKSSGQAASYTQVFADMLADMADADDRVVAITAAMPGGTGLTRFAARHPDRCFDVGIAEQHAVTFAGGLAASGKRPYVAIYSTFMQRAYDQIIHDICIQNLPVTFCLDRAGIVGADGATHTGMFDLAFMRNLPNMTVMAPKDEAELRRMLVTSLTIDGPVAIRYPRGHGYGVSIEDSSPLPVGHAEVLTEGDSGLVIAVGSRVHDALQAVETLRSEHGRAMTLLNLRFIKPLDEQAIMIHLKSGQPLIIVEEGVAAGGAGQQIAVLALQHGWHGPFAHIAMPDAFPAHGTQAEILRDLGLDAAGILSRLRQLIA
ncbi:1-deoxy-D-xylulose-5-phosphate synthase [Mariprofundus ferrooxydans]|uniref:1-deoxy-D-xylulose-5-phosphate synthase n=1 Tax=Mariprofundus ferrooxydans PV-1 TaxID=314345 RepID=Q0F186_9PROT|nr:1-deoxy-D-xylulose-5-phosphate synthase [Mariprofundus ferrooxydans]EAU55305.1 1-deoxy-D-xylulose-5-phosphate synthase [Mariprofundus ferrooxydans PV-1]KON47183.1 1-deoxy-D-xylulose-5-phosphate synthase [Mariprofundus ferrooxydans]